MNQFLSVTYEETSKKFADFLLDLRLSRMM